MSEKTQRCRHLGSYSHPSAWQPKCSPTMLLPAFKNDGVGWIILSNSVAYSLKCKRDNNERLGIGNLCGDVQDLGVPPLRPLFFIKIQRLYNFVLLRVKWFNTNHEDEN